MVTYLEEPALLGPAWEVYAIVLGGYGTVLGMAAYTVAALEINISQPPKLAHAHPELLILAKIFQQYRNSGGMGM